jgi:hypothetical protein
MVFVRASDPEPTRGKVLVFDNERTLEGDIERVGGQYRIRHQIGESWVPGEKVLRLCAGREEAYAFLRSRANLDDPDERLRLARWCHSQGRHDQAVENVRAAVALRPDHAESRRLLNSLERMALTKSRPQSPSSGGGIEPAAVPELNGESLSSFATRVQPILMNACANCHATGRGGAFKLVRTYENSAENRRSLQQNLAAVLGQINLQQPQSSLLLTKAITAHGEGTQAPLAGRQMVAFRSLESWVLSTQAKNPQLREPGSSAPLAEGNNPALLNSKTNTLPAENPAAGTTTPGTPGTRSPTPMGAEGSSLPAPGGFAAGRAVPEKTRPAAPPGPVDPFDPIIFNRESPSTPKGNGKKS